MKLIQNILNAGSAVFGLSAINGIGPAIAELIVGSRNAEKPYVSIQDFFRRCSSLVLKKSTIEHLCASGAFDELFDNNLDDLSRLKELEILEREKEDC